jgi:prepilin signal peptidase PulO-like enzyme (type II secretory pathway)
MLIYVLLFSILLIMFIVSLFGILVYMFPVSKEHVLIPPLSSMVCRSVIRWLEMRTLYVYMVGRGDCVMFLSVVSLNSRPAHFSM